MLRLNQSYGHRHILLDYAGYADRPVHAFLQHGWTLVPDAGSGRYANSKQFRRAPRLFWSRRQANEATAAGVPHSLAIGAPFLYLAALQRRTLFPFQSSSTSGRILVYPQHSAEFTAKAASSEGVDQVAKAVRAGHPVTVCLHPVDASRSDVVAAYMQAGSTVIQHGTGRFDQRFLIRQMESIVEHDIVWSYGLGSAAFYAAALGVPVEFFNKDRGPQAVPPREAFGVRTDVYEQLHASGSFPEFARAEMGVDCMCSRDDLATLLGVTGIRSLEARALRRLGRMQAFIRHRVFGDITASG